MIRLTQGNLLEAPAEALVNTVNEKGVMGKGIALMFKETFPESAKAYQAAARRGEVQVGKVFVTERIGNGGPRWIIHFPTKKHWRNPSRVEWVRDGLQDLVRVIRQLGIRSIALPPLGSGQGQLDWNLVRAAIESAMEELADVDVLVFEPTSAYLSAPKQSGVKALTAARALIAELVRRYSVLGLDCSMLEVQKLAWFLQRAILSMGLKDPLRLEFSPDNYGPYADRLRHLLDSLDGSYLHSEKRIADSGPFEPIWFEAARREEVAAYLHSQGAADYIPALEKTTALIDGFESPLGMELLATVDWILQERKPEQSVSAVRNELKRWPGRVEAGQRKLRLFDDRLVGLALQRLVGGQPLEGQKSS
ncbi:MAG: Appr-1-p processing protein [Candidatus Eisenbacteria bacterium RBG_16_71_46]|nr:MAG: Appr-1-p processing protein [Candidatus Eisenbacteria bacterium RBG_16_71_46]